MKSSNRSRTIRRKRKTRGIPKRFINSVISDILGMVFMNIGRKTFENADVLLMNQWINDSDSVPNKVLEYLSMKGKTVDDLDKQAMKDIRGELRLTWHEVSNRALQLVSRDIHEMMSQTGGVSYSKILVAHGNTQALLKPLAA